jgi:putative MFS transporter
MQIGGFAGACAIAWIIAIWMGAGFRHYAVIILLLMGAECLSQYGPGTVTGVYPAELFPTRRRATALGVATATSRLGGIVGALLLGYVNSRAGFSGMLWVAGAFMGIGALITVALAKETKNLPLEEISTDYA